MNRRTHDSCRNPRGEPSRQQGKDSPENHAGAPAPASVPLPRVGSRRLCRLRWKGAVLERSRATRRRPRTLKHETNLRALRREVTIVTRNEPTFEPMTCSKTLGESRLRNLPELASARAGGIARRSSAPCRPATPTRTYAHPGGRTGVDRTQPGAPVPVPLRVGTKCPGTVPGVAFVRGLQGLANQEE
jgi:hypothetical protein